MKCNIGFFLLLLLLLLAHRVHCYANILFHSIDEVQMAFQSFC